jgi:glycosyltransferase involved in cell wall biosynthesis
MRFTDLPISISETDTLYLKKLGLGDKIILSSNGIPKRNSILKTVVERKYDIVYVGRIIDRKNIPLILRIFRELRDYSYSVKMLIITNTENDKMSFVYDFIRQWKLEDNIHVIKDATEDLKFDLLGDSKISINLSRDETFSISTMESAYMGNALLLSNETFFKSIYGEAAIYVDPAEISNTVNIILKILNDNTMLEQRMRMSRALAERYTYDQTVDSEIEQIVSKLSDRV